MSSIDVVEPIATETPGQPIKRVITPAGKMLSSLDKRMTVEDNIVDELLLVCGVIGTTTDAENELIPVTDCLNWLQDLQRALRRDEDLYRPISLLLGKWKVVEQKLLPLVMTCRYDTPMVLTIVKILVILTKPLADNTQRAGRMVIDTKKTSKDVIQQQIKIRDNALQQADLLLEYKRLICHHASHQTGRTNGLLSIFVSLLAEPLSKSGPSRTDTDHLTIELVLHLFRNLLAAELLLHTSHEASRQSKHIHHALIALFEKEMVLEIILVLGQELELRENAQYNLLMMELLHHLFKSQDPTDVARCNISSDGGARTKKNGASSLLSKKRKEERFRSRAVAGNRHGHFGGTWIKEQQDGKRQYLGAAKTNNEHSLVPKRKNKRAEAFIVSSNPRVVYSNRASVMDSPATKRAHESLNKFCERFVQDCYGPVMKSLKNEFRRDSARLENDDKVVFFRIVWFLKHWWRSSKKRTCVGPLIFTMDVFFFTLTLNASDHFYQHKQYSRVAQSVALYNELLHLLHIMQNSTDETETMMALGLMDRLFYNSDPLDRLPKLLNRWKPSTHTREYACDLAEIAHMSLKLLDTNVRKFQTDSADKNGKGTMNRVEKMKAVAAEFDVKTYFCKKIVSNELVWMYTQLLYYYKTNTPLVQHRVIAMFMRISATEIALPEAHGPDVPINPLGVKRSTLEPMLYTLPLIMLFEQVLNDASVRGNQDHDLLVRFGTDLLYNFWQAAQTNPLLYAECVFLHKAPHRFCELVTNLYVGEELRMIAEREMLLDEQREAMDLGEDDNVEGAASEDEDELELTMEGDGMAVDDAQDEPKKSVQAGLDESETNQGEEGSPSSVVTATKEPEEPAAIEKEDESAEIGEETADESPSKRRRLVLDDD